MREVEFLASLRALAAADVAGLDADAKAALLAAAGERLRAGETAAACEVVPFVPGRRPVDEAAHPWLGSSDQAALVLDDADDRPNAAYVLIDVAAGDAHHVELDVTLSFARPDGTVKRPLPGWDRRPVHPRAFAEKAAPADPARPRAPAPEAAPADPARPRTLAPDAAAPDPARPRALVPAAAPPDPARLREVDLAAGESARLALEIAPRRDLLRDPDGADPYTFEHLFARDLRVDVRVRDAGRPVAGATATLFVCDYRRLGSLYRRLIDRLIAPDAARQAQAAAVDDPGAAFHPWYPVLEIGGDKASLYGRALIGDIVAKRRNLTDPGWLLRVGLWLEFLTFLGIVEAVRDDAGDLLGADERAAFERGAAFAGVRRLIDPGRWREVWALREIAFARPGQPRAGPVAARNLLRKRKATLAFLEAHHEDLKAAIELAGPNHHNAQETWQRVFRDAERAVLRSTPAAFPELGFLPDAVRELVLWHRQGELGLARLPGPLARVLGDQDGLFASACAQYRDSMNAVAAWCKERASMDYTGEECIPREASLLETRIARPAQVAALQRRDGYEARLDLPVDLPRAQERSHEEVARLLAGVPILALLTREERDELARTARPLTLGPLERIVVQGQPGTSLFVVVAGSVEVILRQDDGREWSVESMGAGAVVGEMSLLTGAPRSATVRAVGELTVVEIGRQQYEPLLRARPALLDELAELVQTRFLHRAQARSAAEAARERTALRDRIRAFILSG